MGCGCRGRSGGNLPSTQLQASGEAKQTKRIAVYEVMVNGSVAVTTTSPTQARSEARRLNGSVRVTSRAAEPVTADA